jgi:hypothetical protein
MRRNISEVLKGFALQKGDCGKFVALQVLLLTLAPERCYREIKFSSPIPSLLSSSIAAAAAATIA